MSAIVTEQFRILNATNFVNSVKDSTNSYYVFLGLPNPSPYTVGFGRTDDWNTNIPNPTDNIDYLNHYGSTILFGRKISSANIRRVIRKINWVSGQRYEMYRPDYSVINPSPITESLRLYDANYYVINADYKVYICIDNGSSGLNPKGNASQVEPTFTDLEPAKSSDGYTWKYLYTVSPSDIIKFDSTEYITLPNDWESSTDSQISAIRDNGNSSVNDNQIKKVYIQNQGLGYPATTDGPLSCDLVGDGSGGKVSVTIDTSNKITDVIVTSGGKNYTYALVDLITGANPGIYAELIPIIPPSKGHGFDIYKELGADKVLIYARFDDSTKDFPVDTKFAQIGIIKNPTIYDETGISTSVYTQSEFSSTYAMRFEGSVIGTPLIGDVIKQSVTGGTAFGYVVSYDSDTKVLKYIQDRSLYFGGGGYSTHVDFVGMSSFFDSNNTKLRFESGKSVSNKSGTFSATIGSFTGISTTVSNKIIGLGVSFQNGLASPEINSKSGDIIYIDNRSLVERNSRQKEDIKVILEF